MHIEWEEHDIKPGSFLIRKSHLDEKGKPNKNAEFATFQIGFISADPTVYGLVSVLDGMFCKMGTMSEFVTKINNSKTGYLPIYGEQLSEILEKANTV